MMNPNAYKLVGLLTTLILAPGVEAQSVYRCEEPDGSIVFSDLPCRSDNRKQVVVDATPHQGHRPSPGGSAVEVVDGAGEDASRRLERGHSGLQEEREGAKLSRRERLSLQGERKRLLSGLKRRHVDESERRALIRELRRVDSRLGIGPGEVNDMPFHNREIYEDYPVFPDD